VVRPCSLDEGNRATTAQLESNSPGKPPRYYLSDDATCCPNHPNTSPSHTQEGTSAALPSKLLHNSIVYVLPHIGNTLHWGNCFRICAPAYSGATAAKMPTNTIVIDFKPDQRESPPQNTAWLKLNSSKLQSVMQPQNVRRQRHENDMDTKS